MSGIIKVSVTYDKPPNTTVRVWREVMRGAHEAMGTHWYKTHFPRHFSRSAATRYQYTPRSPKTRAKKIALARRGIVKDGGLLPLVHSGDTRAMTTAHASIRGFPTRATVTMQAPHYVRIRPMSGQPSLYSELTRTIASERKSLSNILDREVSKRFNSYKRTQREQVT